MIKKKPKALRPTAIDTLEKFLLAHSIPLPLQEYKFHDERRWRFDYAWPSKMVALEVEGGIFTGGRHTRGVGYLNDMEKYNNAAILGWKVLRVSTMQLFTQGTIDMLHEVLN